MAPPLEDSNQLLGAKIIIFDPFPLERSAAHSDKRLTPVPSMDLPYPPTEKASAGLLRVHRTSDPPTHTQFLVLNSQFGRSVLLPWGKGRGTEPRVFPQ